MGLYYKLLNCDDFLPKISHKKITHKHHTYSLVLILNSYILTQNYPTRLFSELQHSIHDTISGNTHLC